MHSKAQFGRVSMNKVKASGMDILLPLLKRRVRRWGRLVSSVGPPFACYLCLPADRQDQGAIDFLPTARDLVRFGKEPSPIPSPLIEEFKQRCAAGPVELPSKPLKIGAPVRGTRGSLAPSLRDRPDGDFVLSDTGCRSHGFADIVLTVLTGTSSTFREVPGDVPRTNA